MATTSTMKPAKKLPLPPKGFVSRAQAQDLLCVSQMTLIEWERRGFVHPIVARSRTSNHECFYYDATELATCPTVKKEKFTPSPGEIAARVFECFYANKSIAEIVVELRLQPAVIEDLREQWRESIGEALLVSQRAKAELSTSSAARRSATRTTSS